MKKWNEKMFLASKVKEGMGGEQIVGMMIAQMNAHYQAEHQAILYGIYGAKDDPILLLTVLKKAMDEKVGDVKDIQDNTGIQLEMPKPFGV